MRVSVLQIMLLTSSYTRFRLVKIIPRVYLTINLNLKNKDNYIITIIIKFRIHVFRRFMFEFRLDIHRADDKTKSRKLKCLTTSICYTKIMLKYIYLYQVTN